MALDPHYIPAYSIEDILLDKDTGAPLSGGKVYFEQDNQPGVLKPVYQITGTSPNYSYVQLPNPVILSSIGTFEDSLGNPVIPYFYPYDADGEVELYRIIVESSDDVPQFVREAQPYIDTSGTDEVSSAFTNEITNPQFAEILYNAGPNEAKIYSFNTVVNEVISFAPGWDFVVTAAGAGSVTVIQFTPPGSANVITNPSTVLRLNSSGLSSFKLRQRIYGSPNLWGGQWISANFVGKSWTGTDLGVDLYYSQSSGTIVDELIIAATLPADGEYTSFTGNIEIPNSTNSDSFPDAYIDIYFDLPLSVELSLTSVMVTSTGTLPIETIIYDQTSTDRQVDQTFHYWQPALNFKPIPSYLVGWDFRLNPAQFGSSGTLGAIGANKCDYIIDQTILFRTANTNIDWSVGAENASNRQLVISPDSDNQFALIQYLDGPKLYDMNLNQLSSEIWVNTDSEITMTISLWYTTNANLPNMPVSTNHDTFFTGLDANGKPTGAISGWTEIVNANGDATFSALISDNNIYGFSGWDGKDMGAILAPFPTYFAIVVGTGLVSAGTECNFAYCSVVPGTIPTAPAPQTYDQVLRECQYYWRSSFLPGTTPAQNVGINSGEAYAIQVGGVGSRGKIIVRFPSPMRTTPEDPPIFYNPAAANDQIRVVSGASDYSTTALVANTLTANGFIVDGLSGSGANATIGVHYTANARLGDV